jgi:hypothetical protein
VLVDGQTLSGLVTCGSLLIPEGAEVLVEEDLELTASGPIRIAGTLRGADRSYAAIYQQLSESAYAPSAQPLAAEQLETLSKALRSPRIALSSSAQIHLEPTGLILGGDSASYGYHGPFSEPNGHVYSAYELTPGVAGGDILLQSPDTRIDGQIRGGRGGGGGAGGQGGKGGSVYLSGAWSSELAAYPAFAIGGSGGSTAIPGTPPDAIGGTFYPAIPAARGGDGGDVVHLDALAAQED